MRVNFWGTKQIINDNKLSGYSSLYAAKTPLIAEAKLHQGQGCINPTPKWCLQIPSWTNMATKSYFIQCSLRSEHDSQRWCKWATTENTIISTIQLHSGGTQHLLELSDHEMSLHVTCVLWPPLHPDSGCHSFHQDVFPVVSALQRGFAASGADNC